MKTTKFFYWVIIFFLATNLSGQITAYNRNDWKFKYRKDDISVYFKNTGHIYDLKLLTEASGRALDLKELLQKVDLFPQWIYKVKESRVLKQVSNEEVYYYILIDFPWPLQDRDMIMHSRIYLDKDGNGFTSVSTAAPDFIGQVPNVIRIRDANIYWRGDQKTENTIAIEYISHSDPGGNLPDWVVNLAMDVGPRESIKKMKQLIKK